MVDYLKDPYSAEQVEAILNPTVKKWFFSRFKSFSLPQLYGVLEIHKRNNILVSAPTGATKTLTGFLSILNELVDSAEKGILQDKVYCIYISPLKALNRDIERNLVEPLEEMDKIAGKELGIRVAVRTGDTSQAEKAEMLKHPPHILVTTPESLAILLSSYRFIEHLKDVQWCIIDEIHALADNKRGVHLSISIERLQQLSQGMTRVGLSATVAPLEEIAKFLAGYRNEVSGTARKSEIFGMRESKDSEHLGNYVSTRYESENKLRPCKIVDVQFIKELDLKVLSPLDDFIDVTQEQVHNKLYNMIDKLIQQHKTTLIFTNTRSATERVVDHLKDKFPKSYNLENIGAHHGSLSKRHRVELETNLRNGKLKVVVCSTSLELGIDIGYIDLVILLSSPKSVARCLQRTGRSGHRLHDITKGRIIVLDRDDLIECAVLLKNAVEKKIDKIHIPTNCLDVLAQQIDGIAISQKIHIDELFNLIRQSYCYNNLQKKDFLEIINYLSGEYASLEDRYIYAKIWYDKETGFIGRRGKMGRVIYMTNIGTIPDETFITVKIGNEIVGYLDEGFLERLKPGDVFVLGGNTYQFKFSRGMVAQVSASASRPPTVPSWFSEQLPLSFDLAMEISKFRRLMEDHFTTGKSETEIKDFIKSHLYVDDRAANAVYNYFKEQYDYAEIPSDKKMMIEYYDEDRGKYAVFHTVYGRRVNDCLSRALAFVISRQSHINVEIGINDNGFYLMHEKRLPAKKAIEFLKEDNIEKVANFAIEKTEVMKRRFRHCASRALMILRTYKGKQKAVGRQQVSSMILMNALKRISPDFCILKEARREVLEDLMDIENTKKVIKMLEEGKIKIKEIETKIPSPFALNLILQGYTDILKMEDRIEFVKRLHQQILAKIALKKK